VACCQYAPLKHITVSGLVSKTNSLTNSVWLLIITDTVKNGSIIYNAVDVSLVLKAFPEETFCWSALAYLERVPQGEPEEGKIRFMQVYEDNSHVLKRLGM
jgi:hypothetical protein